MLNALDLALHSWSEASRTMVRRRIVPETAELAHVELNGDGVFRDLGLEMPDATMAC